MRTPEAKPQFNRDTCTLNEIYRPGAWVTQLYETEYGVSTTRLQQEHVDSLLLDLQSPETTMHEGNLVIPKGRIVMAEITTIDGRRERIGAIRLGVNFRTRLISVGRSPLIGLPDMAKEGVFQVNDGDVTFLKRLADRRFDMDSAEVQRRFIEQNLGFVEYFRTFGTQKIANLELLLPIIGRPEIRAKKSAREINEAKAFNKPIIY